MSSSPIANVIQGERHRYVVIAGDGYTTLRFYLGTIPMKSKKKTAADSGASAQVEYRHGDWQTLVQFKGKEILPTMDFASYRQSNWVATSCPQLDSRANVSRCGSWLLVVRLLRNCFGVILDWKRARVHVEHSGITRHKRTCHDRATQVGGEQQNGSQQPALFN